MEFIGNKIDKVVKKPLTKQGQPPIKTPRALTLGEREPVVHKKTPRKPKKRKNQITKVSFSSKLADKIRIKSK